MGSEQLGPSQKKGKKMTGNIEELDAVRAMNRIMTLCESNYSKQRFAALLLEELVDLCERAVETAQLDEEERAATLELKAAARAAY